MRKLGLSIYIIRSVSALALLAYCLFMYPTWMFDSGYVAFPALDFLDSPVIRIVVGLIYCASLIVIILFPMSGIAMRVLLITVAGWVLIDLNHFHPVFLSAVPLLLIPKGTPLIVIRHVIQLSLGVVFVAAAVNRINPSFALPFYSFFSHEAYPSVHAWVIAFTVIEFFLGLALILFDRKSFPVWAVVVVLLGITLFMAWNSHFVEIIWLLYLMFLAVLLLLNQPEQHPGPLFHRGYIGLGLLLIVTALACSGIIHGIFGFQLYSGKTSSAIVIFSDQVLKEVPKPYSTHIARLVDDTPYIDLTSVYRAEYNCLPFPTIENFRKIASPLKTIPFTDEEMAVMIKTGHGLEIGHGITVFTRSNL